MTSSVNPARPPIGITAGWGSGSSPASGGAAWVAGVVLAEPLLTVTDVPETPRTRSRSWSMSSSSPSNTGAVAASETVMVSTVPAAGAVAMSAPRVAGNGDPNRGE